MFRIPVFLGMETKEKPAAAGQIMEYKDTFKSTAEYYVKYREGYPESLFTFLKDRLDLNGFDLVMDLGCGPGTLAIPLTRYAREVIAIDPEPEMLIAGMAQAESRGIRTVRWVTARSDDLNDLPDDMRNFKLVTIGRAFHWMDREKTLKDLAGLLHEDGGVAIVWNSGTWREYSEELQKSVRAVLVKYLGERRRAGSGYYDRPETPHEEIVAKSCLKNVEMWHGTWPSSATVDDIIGYYYSTSMANPNVLGASRAAFEAELTEALLRLNPSGIFGGEGTTHAILARK